MKNQTSSSNEIETIMITCELATVIIITLLYISYNMLGFCNEAKFSVTNDKSSEKEKDTSKLDSILQLSYDPFIKDETFELNHSSEVKVLGDCIE